MAINFPTSLDDFINYVDGVTIMESALLNDMQFAIEALQAKVGIDSSIVTTSHDYKLANQKILQIVNTQTGAVNTGSTIIPFDNTIPQKTEGNEYMTLAITPTNSNNKLKIEIIAIVAHNVNSANISMALFQDGTANALAASVLRTSTTGNRIHVFTHFMTAGTTSSTTFKIRIGANVAGTLTFNGVSSARIHGGVMASSITITEYKS